MRDARRLSDAAVAASPPPPGAPTGPRPQRDLRTYAERLAFDGPPPPPRRGLFGGAPLRLLVSAVLDDAIEPEYPDHKEDARRLVRHGYASARLSNMTVSVMEWLDEDVGPAPGAPAHKVYVMGGNVVLVGRRVYNRLSDGVTDGPFSIGKET